MSQAEEGVDYHRDGADVHPALLALMLAAILVPVALTALLLLVVLPADQGPSSEYAATFTCVESAFHSSCEP